MKENNFENQVRKKIDELKMDPTQEVWQKIEKDITKGKPRRRILFFFPLMIIGIIYGGYILFNNNNNSKQRHLYTQILNDENESKIIKVYTDSISGKPFIKSKMIATPTNSTYDLKLAGFIKPKNNSNTSNKSFGQDTKKVLEDTTDTSHKFNQDNKLNIEKNFADIEKPTSDQIDNLDRTFNPSNKLINQTTPDIIMVEQEKTRAISTDTLKKATKTLDKHTWKFSISFAGGASGLGKTIFGHQEKQFNPPVNSINPTPFISEPSLIKTGKAFIAGISAVKKVSKKISLITGIYYKMYSSTNSVGVDTANYYRANSSVNTHHNYYHYIELPVGIKTQITSFKKIQLYWNISASISKLLGSNALQFNNRTQLYYRDNSELNKRQFGFSSGFDVGFINKQNGSLFIGPYMNYGISKTANTGLYKKQHFTFLGLRVQLPLRKK